MLPLSHLCVPFARTACNSCAFPPLFRAPHPEHRKKSRMLTEVASVSLAAFVWGARNYSKCRKTPLYLDQISSPFLSVRVFASLLTEALPLLSQGCTFRSERAPFKHWLRAALMTQRVRLQVGCCELTHKFLPLCRWVA